MEITEQRPQPQFTSSEASRWWDGEKVIFGLFGPLTFRPNMGALGMSSTALQRPQTKTLVQLAESAIRSLVRDSNFPPDLLIEIAREEQRDQWTAENAWAAASVEGDKAKPLIENRSGPSFTSEELAARLKVTTQTIRNMKERKELVAYTGFGAHNPLRFPSWQFVTAGSRLQTKQWIKPLLEAYGSNGWGLVDFMTVPRTPLNGLSYLASTERGEDGIRDVIDAAGRSNPD